MEPTWLRPRRGRREPPTRITLYVPPELARRLAAARKRLDLNVSAICQDALTRALDALEAPG